MIDDKLVVSSFGRDIDDNLYYLNHFSRSFMLNQEPLIYEGNHGTTWPNEVRISPQLIDGQKVLAVASGFFTIPLPGSINRSGTVSLYAFDEAPRFIKELKPVKYMWFYHRPKWKDMNGDGLLDLVTARSNFNPIKSILNPILLPPFKVQGKLVWFEQPRKNALSRKWKEHHLISGPELFFEFKDLNGDGVDEIIATESFQKELNIYHLDRRKWRKTTITSKLGLLFGLEFADINGDGKEDLVVTNHENDEKAGVFAFDIPHDFKDVSAWKQHNLLVGIETLKEGEGQASPGGTRVIKPFKGYKGKPWIVVSGDGSQKIHLLRPISEKPENWSYKEDILLDTETSITGNIEVKDLDKDGWPEIIVPEYDKDLISVVSIKTFIDSLQRQ